MADVLLICGNGEEVDKSISALKSAGVDVALVGIKGVHSIDSSKYRFEEISPGDIGRLFSAIDTLGVRRVAMVGSFAGIRISDIVPDSTALSLLQRRGFKPGEMNLFQWMSVALEVITSRGAKLVSITDFTPLVSQLDVGFATELQWTWERGECDFQLARRVQEALCQLEVGESVVVRDRTIVGIEVANDSTDALLARVGRGASRSGVLVKWPFFDFEGNVRTSPIPKIGLKTAELANAANLQGIVIHPVTQVWDKAEVVRLLNENHMFLCVQEERNRQH